jgi:hypothetical protein
MKMSWNSSAYTALGSSMLTEALSGKRMTFTRAVGGAGTVQTAELPNATEVADQKQSLILASSEMTGEGEDAAYKIKIQISNNGLQQGYTLHQIGIYAKLDDSDSDALAVIFQDDHGFEIQPEAAMNNFLMEFFGVLAISNTAQIYLTADPNAIATEKWVREILARHDKDPEAHAATIKAAASAAVDNHNGAKNAHSDIRASVASMNASVKAIELRISTNVTKNPFSTTFGSLDGLTVAGVWNADLARIEF